MTTNTPDTPRRDLPQPIQAVKPAPVSNTKPPASPLNQPKTSGWVTGQ